MDYIVVFQNSCQIFNFKNYYLIKLKYIENFVKCLVLKVPIE